MKPSVPIATAALIVLLAASGTARAQFAFPSPDQQDMTIDARTRGQVLDTLLAEINARYVFPETGKSVERAFRAKQKRGDYDRITSAKEFADSLSSQLQAIGKDRHFRVLYYQQELPRVTESRQPPPEEMAHILDQSRTLNFGFDRVQRMMGNVGYLELRAFDGAPEAGPIAQAAMTLLANTDALIIDLRRNGGGDPNMIVLLLSYLYGAGDRVHVNDFYLREGDRTEQYWTLPSVPGPRYAGKDVYVLTSRRTGSAAEEFSYDVKNLERGTLYGETTAGAANPGELRRVHDNFAAFISNGRAINPITKTNWEGVGVTPDVAVSAEDALKTAHVAAITRLLEQAKDAERKSRLTRALEIAKNAPIEPLDLGRPPAPAKSAAAKN